MTYSTDIINLLFINIEYSDNSYKYNFISYSTELLYKNN